MMIAARFKCAVALGLIVGLGVAFSPAEAKPAKKVAATFLGEKFPVAVAGFRYASARDYESEQRGGGYGIRYQDATGAWADVFVYDLGRGDIPSRYDEKTSYDQLALVGQAIRKAVEIGAYRNASSYGSFVVPASGTPRLNCDRYLIVPKAGDARDSIACVTNRNAHFFKIRLDAPKGTLGSPSIDAFLKAWVR